jgi:hypothetical protein
MATRLVYACTGARSNFAWNALDFMAANFCVAELVLKSLGGVTSGVNSAVLPNCSGLKFAVIWRHGAGLS